MTVWIKRLLAVIVVLPGLLFVIMGLRWLIAPAGIAPSLGMTIDTGFGLSSQVGMWKPDEWQAIEGLPSYAHAVKTHADMPEPLEHYEAMMKYNDEERLY